MPSFPAVLTIALLLFGVPMGMHEPALHVRYDKIVSLGWIDAKGCLLSKPMPKS